MFTMDGLDNTGLSEEVLSGNASEQFDWFFEDSMHMNLDVSLTYHHVIEFLISL